MSELVLPDSRMKNPKATKTMYWPGAGNIQVEKVYCANCGELHGWVPSENTTYAFWLCTYCSETWGEKLPGYMMPDEVYWDKVFHETGGMNFATVQALLESTWSALSKLIREQPKGR